MESLFAAIVVFLILCVVVATITYSFWCILAVIPVAVFAAWLENKILDRYTPSWERK